MLAPTQFDVTTERRVFLRRYALNYLFLGVICFLFRPSFNSTRFAYSELEGGLL